MSWLKLKIGGRLALSFGALLLLFALTNYIAIINMEKLADRTEMLYKHPFTVSTAVLRIRANVIKLYDQLEYYRLDLRHSDHSLFKQQLLKLNKSVEIDFNIILDRFLGDKGDIENSYDLYKKWYALLLEESILVLELYLKNNNKNQSGNYYEDKQLQEKIDRLLRFSQSEHSKLDHNLSTQSNFVTLTLQKKYKQLFDANQIGLQAKSAIKELNHLLLRFRQPKNNTTEQEKILDEIKYYKENIKQYIEKIIETLPTQKIQTQSLNKVYQTWKQNFNNSLIQSFNTENQIRLNQIENNNHVLFKQLNERMEHINNFAKNKADLFLNHAKQLKIDTLKSMYYLIGFIVILIILFAFLIIRSIVNPLHHAVDFAKRLSLGNLNSRVANKNQGDETSELLQAMNDMAGSFQNVIDDTRKSLAQLAQGNTQIDLQSDFVGDFDAIKAALYITADKLGESNRENQQQAWLKSGQTLLNKQIQGKQNLNSLSKNSLDFLVDYLGCSIGLFYYCHQDEEVPYLRICASYGYPKNQDDLQDKFYKGDGLVGQSLITQKIFIREHTAEEYHCVPQSGLAWAIPKYVCIVPCNYENKVKAVLEIGSFKPFSAIQQEFLQQVMPNIAIAINTLESHSDIERVLAQQAQNLETTNG